MSVGLVSESVVLVQRAQSKDHRTSLKVEVLVIVKVRVW